MQLALFNGKVLHRGEFTSELAVVVEGERIAAVVPAADLPADIERFDLAGRTLLPGFIDAQVNGGGGVLFNAAPTVEAIRAIGAAHRQFGTTGFLPTLISADLDTIRQAVAAVDQAIASGVPGVLGLHIEGPFLSQQRRGIHDADRIMPLDNEGFAVITSLHRGKTLVTLAPECTTPEMIRRLTQSGVIVAAGHTNATYNQTRLALDHGVTGFTHLFNAMSQLTVREPGVVGAALIDPGSWCSLIADGYHVDAIAMQIALRCKADNSKFFLVTDAMPSVGSNEAAFTLQGEQITVADGACRNREGRLAGAHLNMAQAVWKAAEMLGISLSEAVTMATANPAEFLGLSGRCGRIEAGLQADLIVVDDSGRVCASWIAGATQDPQPAGGATP